MKIGIVGAGFVGSTAAYAMVMRGVGRQIVLVDKSEARARAEADDLLHAVPFAHPLDVVAGGYADLAGARVVDPHGRGQPEARRDAAFAPRPQRRRSSPRSCRRCSPTRRTRCWSWPRTRST